MIKINKTTNYQLNPNKYFFEFEEEKKKLSSMSYVLLFILAQTVNISTVSLYIYYTVWRQQYISC